jgi:hypothetical protein
MLRKSLMVSASLGLAIISTAPARADICFAYTLSGGGVGIAIGAKVPATPNTCDRVTVVGADGGVATGSICRSEEGSSKPTLVYHYVFSLCGSSYFETATCRLDLELNGNLPSQISASQASSCSGLYLGLAPGPNQSGPLHGFSYANDLKAWNCSPGPFAVIGGGGAACYARRRGAPQ